ncbi:MAG: 16S rRNA processing protein RimM [Clostridia bacterium]|nr:16S rRNA processing protein RimM [Clostridia bacterium]
MEEYFEIGQIVNTSGLKGEIKIKPFTDDITKFNNFKTIYVSIKKELKEFEVEKVRFSKNMVFLKLKGIDTIEEAENYRNLYIKRKRDKEEKLEEDTYYIVDLIGCRVYADDQKELGEVVDVFSTGSNDIYVVKDELGKQVLLPAIKDVIKNVDIENRTIIVHLLEGLI